MAKLKLTYFDFPGGRVEPARLALHIGGIEFEDFRFSFAEFAEVKKTMPLKQVPVLEIDGQQITQCNGINRYVGKLAGLYPQDDYQALLCDEIMDALEDAVTKLARTFGLQGEELQSARETLVAGPLTQYLAWADEKLEGDFFVGDSLTMADLKVMVWVKTLNAGHLEHIPTDLVERLAPKLNAHAKRIGQTPAIAEYYA